jgi:hypothetical protein
MKRQLPRSPSGSEEVLQSFLQCCNVLNGRRASLGELLRNRDMAEKHADGSKESNLGDSGLEEHIAHWSEVLDSWVKRFDTRLGRNAGGSHSSEDDVPSGDGAEPSAGEWEVGG